MSTYVFSVANDTLNGVVDAYRLSLELQGASLPVTSIVVHGDELTLKTSVALSGEQQTLLGQVVGAHNGQPVPVPVNHMAVMIQAAEMGILNQDWPVAVDANPDGQLGCVASKPDFFAATVVLMGQILGSMKVAHGGSGEKPQIRIIERSLSTGQEAVVLGPVDLNATTGFQLLNVVTPAGSLTTGYNEYFLQARLNGAAECKFRGVTCAVIELQ